jgi:putative flippase GtrA
MTNLYLQFAKYVLVGLLNSAVGLVFIFLCMSLGLNDVLSNAVGYMAGFSVSFVVNSKWTFQQGRPTSSIFVRFLLVTGVAYAGNLCVMLVVRDSLHIDHRLAQLFGVATYTLIGFFGARLFAFRIKRNSHQTF